MPVCMKGMSSYHIYNISSKIMMISKCFLGKRWVLCLIFGVLFWLWRMWCRATLSIYIKKSAIKQLCIWMYGCIWEGLGQKQLCYKVLKTNLNLVILCQSSAVVSQLLKKHGIKQILYLTSALSDHRSSFTWILDRLWGPRSPSPPPAPLHTPVLRWMAAGW